MKRFANMNTFTRFGITPKPLPSLLVADKSIEPMITKDINISFFQNYFQKKSIVSIEFENPDGQDMTEGFTVDIYQCYSHCTDIQSIRVQLLLIVIQNYYFFRI